MVEKEGEERVISMKERRNILIEKIKFMDKRDR